MPYGLGSTVLEEPHCLPLPECYLLIFLDSPHALRLSDFINLRINMHKRVKDGELKLSHVNHILSSLFKLNTTLACGLKIWDRGRFRPTKEKSLSKQITDKEVVWDEIKPTQSYLKKQFDDYEQAALKVIGDYQGLYKVTQSIVDN